MGFQPFMILHIFFAGMGVLFYFARKRISPDISAFVIVGMLCSLLIAGVATLGLLSATYVLGPIIALYLVMLGHRKSAYTSIVAMFLYLSIMGFLFVSGRLNSPATPNLYVLSSSAWVIMIVAVGGASIAFVAPFELVPGVLDASEKRFRLAFEDANVGICFINLEGRMLKVNKVLCRMLGYTREELEQMTVYDITHRDDSEASRSFFEQAAAGGRTELANEKRYIRKGGDAIWVHVSSSLILESHGDPRYFISHVQNITERKHAEEALHESERRFHRFFASSPDAFMLFDPNSAAVEWPIVECNESACRMNGYRRDELIGKSITILHPTEGKPVDHADLLNRIRKEGVLHFETSHRHRDGHNYPIEVSASVITLEERELVLGIDRDVTERKRSEEAVRESEEKFRMVFENFIDGICIYDLDPDPSKRKLVECNERYAAMAGRSREELLRLGNTQALMITLEETANENRLRSLARGTEYRGTFSWIRPDGRDNIIQYVGVPITWRGKSLSIGIDRDITERKHAEERLEQSLEWQEAIFEGSRDSVFISDQNSTFVAVNNAACELTGYSREQLLKMQIPDLHDQPDLAVYRKYSGKIMEGEEIVSEAKILRRDGSKVDAEFNNRRIMIAGVPYMHTTARNTAERKRAEEALRKSEERMRAIVEGTPHLFFYTQDAEANTTYVSPTVEQITGYTVDVWLERKDWFITDAKSGQLAKEKTYAHLRGEFTDEPVFVEVRHANGEPILLEVYEYPIIHSGMIIGLQGVAHDITERRHSEVALRESEERFRQLTEAAVEGIAFTDKGVVVDGNERVASMLGYDLKDMIGRPVSDFVAPEAVAVVQDNIFRNYQGSTEHFAKRKDGTLFPVETHSQIMKWHGKDMRVTSLIDISERRHAEEALRQAQKLESIGTLAGGIAHDFNNLLNAILGQSSLALGKLPKESPAKEHIEKSLRAAERAADLTKHLLAYSGKGKLVAEEIDLNRLVKENIQILEVSGPKTVQLLYELGTSILYIHGDVGQIQQVVMNLIINAGEAIRPNPGSIIISTRQIRLTENDAKYSKYTGAPLPAGRYAALSVKDTGHGMTPEVLARIFDPFFTTKFTGRGLGLAAVLGIIRGHRGGVRIESEAGRGTQFEVVFPWVEPSSERNEVEKKADTVVNGGGRTILAIDDEPSILELLDDVFTDANFRLLQTLNPNEGIQLYRKHHDEISLVILDYSMPDMDGRAAFENLVKIDKNVKVILCSGYSEEEMKSSFADIQPVDFVKKPYLPVELLERVSRILS